MKRIKVGVVVSDFPILSETFVVAQSEGLIACGLDVTVICDRVVTAPGVDLTAGSLPHLLARTRCRWVGGQRLAGLVHALPGAIRRYARLALDLISDARLNRYDVLLAHFGTNGRRLARSSRLGVLQRPFVTILHGIDIAQPYNLGRISVFRTMFRRGAAVLPVCQRFRTIAVAGGADARRTRVMPMGVDCNLLHFSRRVWQPDGQGPTLLTVARLVEKKGLAHGMRALALLQDRAPDLPWQWDIIGDGPLRPVLEHLARTLGIGGRIRFRGPLAHADVAAALQNGHVFLLPSVTSQAGDMEGVPVALMEAMAAGLVVISSRHGGIPDLVEHGRTGLLADERDEKVLSEHLEWTIRNPELCHRMACDARLTVETRFNCTVLNNRLAQLLNKIASGHDLAETASALTA